MSIRLHNPFLGVSLQCCGKGRNNRDSGYVNDQVPKRSCRKIYACANKNDWISHGIKFSHFCGENVEILWKNIGLRSGLMVNCVKEPFHRSKVLVRNLAPVWEEGLFLFRCSIFCAVISGVCLLVWYGKLKAKNFVEAKLLPSVCASLSDYIQRDVNFGRVRGISPLSITLESCSVGPHNEEFSCGEIPSIKLRILPFASLRRGRFVIDAVLSNPRVLVAQQRNYTWLGIPYSDGIVPKHLSTEEGIDYRTKTRRIAREEAGARMVQERDAEACEAARSGYILSDPSEVVDAPKENAVSPVGLSTSELVSSMDEKLHWRDHHCMDAGVEYDQKHADLEKSFGVNIPVAGVKFWSRIIPGPIKRKFKRKANGRDLYIAGILAKRRILERSASAARAYFLDLSHRRFSDASHSSGDCIVLSGERDGSGADISSKSQQGELKIGADDDDQYIEAADYLTRRGILTSENTKSDISHRKYLWNESLLKGINLSFIDSPLFSTLSKLRVARNPSKMSSFTDVAETEKTNKCSINDENIQGVEFAVRDVAANSVSRSPGEKLLQSLNNMSQHQQGNLSQGSTFTMSRSMGDLWSYLIQRLKSAVGPKVEDIVAELVEGVDAQQTIGIEKKLPLTLDSIQFKGGTLMLLAYGDKEPR